MRPHNIFLSWSGPRSLFAATTLKHWLPLVIQSAEPWMSDVDIEKGMRNVHEITRALQGIKIGIVCLTPENKDKRWIHYEVGALSQSVEDGGRVCPLLLGGLEGKDVEPPLGTFQYTLPEKDDFWKLVASINRAISDTPIPEDRLKQTYEALWPKLDWSFKNLPKHNVVTAPIRNSDEMLAEVLETVRGLANKLEAQSVALPHLADALVSKFSERDRRLFYGEGLLPGGITYIPTQDEQFKERLKQGAAALRRDAEQKDQRIRRGKELLQGRGAEKEFNVAEVDSSETES